MKLLQFFILLSFSTHLFSQHRHVDSLELPLNLSQASQLHIHNINGSIQVLGQEGLTQAKIKVIRTFKALDPANLEDGKREVHLDSFRTDKHLFLFLKAPNISFEAKTNKWEEEEGTLQYGYTNCNQTGPLGYHYHFDFILWVPKKLAIKMSTLNDGVLSAKNLSGPVIANNLNGPIYLKGITYSPKVKSLNGDIEVVHDVLPNKDEFYSTLNGDIKVTYPANLSAEVSLVTRNGGLFTDFEWTRLHPKTEVVTTSTQKTLYKIQSKNLIKIQHGGPKIQMETLNGNLYLLN